jgi:hypothetical protein
MIKNHVTTLEISKELAKILPNLKSEFLWYSYGHHYHESDGEQGINWSNCEIIGRQRYKRLDYNKNRDDLIVGCPALLLTEVLGVLPAITKTQFINYSLILDIHSKRIAYETQNCDGSIEELKGTEHYFDKTNIATAAARLAIWLVENGHELEVANE